MYHDAYNQLITVDDFWNSATQYRYNASGSRYMRRTGTQAAVYTLRDGSVSVGEYSGSVSTTNWNILLPSGEIVGRQPFSNNPVYYLKDHLGSTRATISSTGAVLESVDYYPFGLEMPGRVTLSGQPTLQRFTGYERVDGERFDYAQARWYDPVIGRFLSVDPIVYQQNPRDLFNLHNGKHLWYSPYAYTFNNPVRYNDPDGRSPKGPIMFNPNIIAAFNKAVDYAKQVTGAMVDFGQNYTDMVEANTIGADKYFHCRANCEAAARGPLGEKTAEIISNLRESMDQLRGGDPQDSEEDQHANRQGRSAPSAPEFRGCEGACADLRPPALPDRYGHPRPKKEEEENKPPDRQ